MDWVLTLAHWFGSAVCAQLTADSYYIGGVPLPLCARCTGMYVGALGTLVFHAWRHPKSIALPRTWILAVIPLFFFAWAGDGVNSFLSSVPGFPHLYTPLNILRLATGTLMGISLGSVMFVLFNSVMWQDPSHSPILAGPTELFALLGLGALLILAVQSGWGLLLYPLALVSLVAILVLNSTLMTALAASLFARLAGSWREVRRPTLSGACLALLLLNTIAVSRLLLGAWLGIQI